MLSSSRTNAGIFRLARPADDADRVGVARLRAQAYISDFSRVSKIIGRLCASSKADSKNSERSAQIRCHLSVKARLGSRSKPQLARKS